MLVRHLRAFLRIRQSFYGVAIALGWVFLHGPGARSVLLVVTIVAVLRLGLSVLVRFVPWAQNPGVRNVVTSAGWLVGSIYYLEAGHSTWGLAFAAFSLILGGWGMLTGLQWLAGELTTYALVLRAFEANQPLNHRGVPVIYVVTEKGVDDQSVWRLTARTTQALWKYRTGPNAEFTRVDLMAGVPAVFRKVATRNRARAVFMSSRAFSSRSREFRHWVAANAGCVVVIRSPLGNDEKGAKDFMEDLRNQCRFSRGPIIGLILRIGLEWKPSFKELGTWVECVDVNFAQPVGRGTSDFIAPLTDKLANIVVPIALSDAALPAALRPWIENVGRAGFPAIADCYLRFRLSRSDVERYLALMDGFECLTRLSVITLIAFMRAQDAGVLQPAIKRSEKKLEKSGLGFGTWFDCLMTLLSDVDGNRHVEYLRRFWHGNLSPVQEQIINRIKGNNDKNDWRLPALKEETQVEWIHWVKDLRNATKGHGVISDANIRTLWQDLHEIFLFMASELKDLTLSSKLILSPSDSSVPIQGWRRDIGTSRPQDEEIAMDGPVTTYLRSWEGVVAPLGRYVLLRQTTVFIWDGLGSEENKGKAAYLDYFSGGRPVIDGLANVSVKDQRASI